MKKIGIVGCLLFNFLVLSTTLVDADILILKNGQVIKNVTIRDEDDSLYCENENQTFYISKSAVDNIIKTGPATLPEKIKDFITFLPQKIRLFVKDYFAFAATIAGILILLAALMVFRRNGYPA